MGAHGYNMCFESEEIRKKLATCCSHATVKIDKTHKKEYDKHDIIWGVIYIFGGLIFVLI